MSFDPNPKDNIYSLPPDLAHRDSLHYVLVQVSERRYQVAEYDIRLDGVLCFRLVGKPLPLEGAMTWAKELTEARKK